MRFVAPAIAALLLLTSCAVEQNPIGGEVRPEEEWVTSIVSLSPSTTELVSPLKFHGILQGRTSECDWPNAALGAPVFVQGTNVNWESIAQVQPDLIIYDAALYGPDEVERIEAVAGKFTFALDATNLEEFKRQILRLGQLIAAETDASDYVDKITGASGSARASVGENPPLVTVLQADGDGYYWLGSDGMLASIIEASGGEVAGAVGTAFVPVDFEALLAANPDVILTDAGREIVLADERLASIRAVQTEQVFTVSPDYLFRAGGRVEEFITELGNVFTTSTR